MFANTVTIDGGRRLSAIVYDVVRERVLSGLWRAGESIPIDQLKIELGVSKQPVMDALRRLSVDGLVEVIPQVGCRVAEYSSMEAVDFFNVFATTEAEITAIAVSRHTAPQVAQLRELNAAIGESLEGDPMNRASGYLALNRQFHGVIQEMSRSPILLRTSSRMWDICDLLIMTSTAGIPLATDVHERHQEHERIIAAIADGDQDAARAEMHGHIVRNIPMITKSA
jgi:DNA-binding GntR family transcriptional regulator